MSPVLRTSSCSWLNRIYKVFSNCMMTVGLYRHSYSTPYKMRYGNLDCTKLVGMYALPRPTQIDPRA